MSIHGIDSTKRHESANADPPVNAGSALGTKWVLMAQPPSPKGNRELLPWE